MVYYLLFWFLSKLVNISFSVELSKVNVYEFIIFSMKFVIIENWLFKVLELIMFILTTSIKTTMPRNQ